MSLRDTKPPTNQNEYVHHLEEEFFRLRQVERTLDANVDFLRSERDRLMAAAEQARLDIQVLRTTVESREEDLGITRLDLEQVEARVEELLAEVRRYDDYTDRLREENRSLVQTVRRVLRGTPVEGA